MTAVLGSQILTLTNPAIANSTTATVTVNPALPQIYTNPSQPSAPPDGKSHSFLLQISNADTVEHTLNLSTSDATIATVSPSVVTFPVGAIQVPISIAGLKLGTTSLNISSPTLGAANIQVYITNLLNGASIGPVVSQPIGVALHSSLSVGPIVSSPVGVTQQSGINIGAVVSSAVGVVQVPKADIGAIISPAVGVVQTDGIPVGEVVSPPIGVQH
jgi:hypothetical protein